MREDTDAADGDRARLGGDLRQRGARCRRSSPRTWPGRSRCAPASSATSSSSRGTSATSPAATPRLTCCMLRFQPEIGPGLDSPLVRYLSAAGGAGADGLRPAAAAAPRRRRDRGDRGRRREPGARRRQRRPFGLDLAEPRAAAVAPPVGARSGAGVRAADGAARRPTRRRGAGRRRGQAAALRARRRQLEVARRDRLRAALRRGRNDRGPGREGGGGQGRTGPASGWPRRAAGELVR